MLPLLAGFTGGAIHAFSGPDHLAAVAPLALDGRRSGLRSGLAWGLGHGAGVAALGVLAVLLRDLVLVERVGFWAEALVGLMLLGVGAWAIAKGWHGSVHPHPRAGASFGVGALHGTAGAGHLLPILPAAGLGWAAAAAYLGAFVLGAALAMALAGFLLGRFAARGSARTLPRLLVGSGVVAVAVGAIWLARAWTFA